MVFLLTILSFLHQCGYWTCYCKINSTDPLLKLSIHKLLLKFELNQTFEHFLHTWTKLKVNSLIRTFSSGFAWCIHVFYKKSLRRVYLAIIIVNFIDTFELMLRWSINAWKIYSHLTDLHVHKKRNLVKLLWIDSNALRWDFFLRINKEWICLVIEHTVDCWYSVQDMLIFVNTSSNRKQNLARKKPEKREFNHLRTSTLSIKDSRSYQRAVSYVTNLKFQ